MVWGVGGSGSDVEEEGTSWRDAGGLSDPCDGFVGDVGGEVVVGILGARDKISVLIKDGIPVVHVPGIEAVEVVEAESVGPVVEGAGGAGLPCGSVVVLADPGGHVSVLAEDFADGAAAFGKDAGVAVVSGGEFGDAGECSGVMIASGDERGARGAAESGGVEAVVAKAFGGEAIHGGRGDAAAEGAELAETAVVDQDEQDVGRAFGGLHGFGELCGIGVEIGAADLAGEMEVGAREDVRCAGSGGLRSCDRLHVRFRHCGSPQML